MSLLLLVGSSLPAEAAPIVSDDFSGPALNTSLWTFVDPVGDSGLVLTGTNVEISLPAGVAHDLWTGSLTAPRLLQAADDEDFEVEVKYDSSITSQYQFQGLVAQQDAQNLVRIDAYSASGATYVFAATVTGGVASVQANVFVSLGAPIYLRLARTGNGWIASYSTDGQAWTPYAGFQHTLQLTEIGPFVGNQGSPPPAHTGSIDHFINTAAPPVTNEVPVAVDDGYATSEDTALAVNAANGVLANDTDADQDPLQAVLVSGVSNGLLTLNTDGSFDYTPAADFEGTDSFTYRANDGSADSNLATVTLTVIGVNDAPTAANDAYQTAPGAALAVAAASGVLANDSDLDQDPLQAVLVGGVANGVLNLNGDGSFDYTPNGGFAGQDSFTYEASDSLLSSNVATVTIDVIGPPAANADGYGLDEDTTLVVSAAAGVLANDVDNVPPADLTAAMVTGPSNGTLTSFAADGGFSYQPNPDFSGVDSFTYQAVDGGNGLTAQATVTLTVNPVNDAPVAANDAYQTPPDTTLMVNAASGVLDNDTDAEPGALQAVLIGGVSNGVLNLSADGSFDYTPSSGFSGSDSFTYQAQDGAGGVSNQATVSIQVSPQIVSDHFSGPTLNTSLWTFLDPVGDSSLVLTGTNVEISAPAGVSHDLWTNAVLAPRLLQAAPDEDFEVEVKFDSSLSSEFQIQGLVAQQDAQNLVRVDVYSNGNSTSVFAATITNGTASAVANVLVPLGAPMYLRLSRTGNSWTARFSADGQTWTTYASFQHTLQLTQIGPFVANIASPATASPAHTGSIDYFANTASPFAPNEFPVAGNEAYSTSEDTSLAVSAANGVLTNDTDADQDPLQAVLASSPSNGLLALNADGSFNYTPAADFNGTDSFSYWANDGVQNSNLATVTLTVDPVNDAPAALGDGYQVDPGAALAVNAADGVLKNDTDLESDPMQAVLVSNVSNGVLNFNADGSFDYTPNGGFSGQDSFTYRASDSLLNSNEATVTIAVFLLPTAVADGFAVDEDAILVVPPASGVLANDLDNTAPAGLTASVLAGTANGNLTGFSADGGFTYEPAADFNGQDSFTYQVVDSSSGLTAQTTVTLTVNPANDPPVALNDGYQTLPDTALIVDAASGVLVNDSDPEQDSFQAVLVGDVSNGVLALNSDGSFSYTPAAGFTGSDSFTYAAQDTSSAVSNVAIVGIQVSTQIASDDFSGPTLDTSVWTFVDPVGDSSLAMTGANVEISVPAGVSHDLWTGGLLAPRLLQAAPDIDFEVEVKFDSAVTSRFQQQGLIAQQDAQNLVRVDFYSTATSTFAFAATIANGVGSSAANVAIPQGAPVYLRLARSGDIWTARYSNDGQAWTTYALFQHSFQLNQIGPFVGNHETPAAASPAHTGSIDYFANISTPPVPNTPPVALDDGYATAEDTALVVSAASGVLANDSDIESDPLLAALTSGVSNGVLNFNADGSFDYTPAVDFNGTDSFTYTASDGTDSSAPATVTLTIDAVSDPPVAANDQYQTEPGTVLNVAVVNGVLANDTDPDLDPLQTVLVSDVSNGVLSLNQDGSFGYTPNPGFIGQDSFTYRASDSQLLSNVASVLIAVADPPTVVADAYAVDEDVTLVISAANGVLANDTDNTPPNDLTASLLSNPANGTLTSFGTNGGFTYQPNLNFAGVDSFTYEAVDSATGVRGEATVTVTVNAINDVPVAVNDSYQTPPDTPLSVDSASGVLANDTDAEPGALTATLVGDVSDGALSFNADGSFDYTPNLGFIGQDGFTYTVQDSVGAVSNLATVTLNVSDGPQITVWDGNSQSFGARGRPQEWVNILGNTTDPDGIASLTYSLNGGPELPLSVGHDYERLVGIGDFNVEIDADDLLPGTNLVSLKSIDGTGAESTTVVNVEYTAGTVWPLPYSVDWSAAADIPSVAQAVDGAWEITPDGLHIVTPGYDRLVAIGDMSWQDYEVNVEFTVHDVPVLPLPDFGFAPAIGIILRWTGHNENYPHTAGRQPRLGFSPLGSIHWYRYEIPPRLQLMSSNGFGAWSEDTSGYSLQLGTTYNMRSRVETTAAGPEYTMTIWERGLPESSGVTLNGVLPPDSPSAGSVLLVAHKVDATFGNVSINPLSTGSNSYPVAVDDTYGTDENTALAISAPGVLTNDSDPNGDSLSVTAVGTAATAGLATVGTDGSLNYDPNGMFAHLQPGQSATDSFTYTVSDGRGGTDTGTVTVTIDGAIGGGSGNNAPVAADDSFKTPPDTRLVVGAPLGVLSNDTDPDLDALQAVLVANVSSGALTLNADGSIDYTPNAGFSGQDSFTYRASDTLLESNLATVTISVEVLNKPPRIASGTIVFEKQVIDSTVGETHAVVAAELTGDNEIDAVATDLVDGSVILYENDGNGGFLTWVIDSGLPGAYPASVGDVDGDGDPDLIAAGYSADTIAWYENLGTGIFSRHDLDAATDGPHSMATVDLDDDGDVDVVTTSQDANIVAWYENDGANNFTPNVIDNAALGAKRAEVGDFDGDGDTDVVSASYFNDQIAWYENDGNENFTKQVIDATADGAYYVYPADVDGDGDLDLFAASQVDHTIAWYRNDGSGGFVANTMGTNAVGARTVIAADLDGDGDMDAVTASADDDTVAWFRNDGSGGFTEQAIDLAALGAYGVFAIDMDRDGDLDVLSASRDADTVAQHTQIQAHATFVDLGGTLVIDSALLLATDPDDGPAELTYTIVGSPAFGELRLNGTALPGGGTFTQADINSGLLSYLHDGVDETPDGFAFTVADGGEDGVQPAAGTFTINPGFADTLVALPLDEGSGTVANDASGSFNDGTLVNGAVFEASSADGSAFSVRFDGVDDGIELGTFDVNGPGLTLAAWFNADSFPWAASEPNLISKATSVAADDHVFMLSTFEVGTAVRLRGRVRIGGTATTLIASSGDLSVGAWRHAAMTYDGAMLRLYLDGAEVGSTLLSGSLDVDPAVPVAVGAQPPGAGSRYFDGLIDDVRILSRALSPVEINQIVTGGP